MRGYDELFYCEQQFLSEMTRDSIWLVVAKEVSS